MFFHFCFALSILFNFDTVSGGSANSNIVLAVYFNEHKVFRDAFLKMHKILLKSIFNRNAMFQNHVLQNCGSFEVFRTTNCHLQQEQSFATNGVLLFTSDRLTFIWLYSKLKHSVVKLWHAIRFDLISYSTSRSSKAALCSKHSMMNKVSHCSIISQFTSIV